MQQLVNPNLTIQGKAGWCLSVAQDVWGVPHLYPKAIDAWNASGATNHPDEQPPSDVCVPVYWSYTESGVQYGHIATWVPGKGVYSSPFDVSYGSQWFTSIQVVTDRINRIAGANSAYLGWSETLSGVQLVKGDNNVAIIQNADNWYNRCNITHLATRGRELGRDIFANYVGQDFLHFVEDCEDDPEATTVTNWQTVGQTAVQDGWQAQLTQYQATVDKLNKTVTQITADDTADKAKLQDALLKVADLTDKLKAVPTTPTTTAQIRALSSIKDFIKKLFGIN